MEKDHSLDENYYLKESIECLNIYYVYIKALMEAGINTIGDLVKTPKDKLNDVLNGVNGRGYAIVRRTLMNMGLLFDFDKELYARFNIPPKLIFVSTDDLPLNQRLISALKNNGILYLGDLLVMNYAELNSLRRVGKLGIKELLNYVHDIGFTLHGEKKDFEEVIEDYRNAGIPLVGDELKLSAAAANPLYKAGIFTLNDFLEYGPNVFNLIGIGKTYSQEIMSAMEKKGIKFDLDRASFTNDEEISKSVMINETVKNAEIKMLIEKKREIAREFQKLLFEREELLKKERELDEKIAYLIKSYKSMGVNDGTRR